MLGQITYKLPECSLKNKLRCHYYNRFMECNFHASYRNNYFQFEFGNDISFKCYNSVFYHLTNTLEGYLTEYKLKRGDIVIVAEPNWNVYSIRG